MQQTLLVTIQGPQRAVDVALPCDVPLYELLPFLLDISGTSQPSLVADLLQTGAVSLFVERLKETLAPTFTLLESGTLDGDVLFLRVDTPQLSSTSTTAENIPETIEPSSLTGGIGITWEKAW